jgi:hypothetical protein
MKPTFLIAALPLAFLTAGPALAQSMCVIAGSNRIMGANMSADFDVSAGQGCTSDIRPQWSLAGS